MGQATQIIEYVNQWGGAGTVVMFLLLCYVERQRRTERDKNEKLMADTIALGTRTVSTLETFNKVIAGQRP